MTEKKKFYYAELLTADGQTYMVAPLLGTRDRVFLNVAKTLLKHALKTRWMVCYARIVYNGRCVRRITPEMLADMVKCAGDIATPSALPRYADHPTDDDAIYDLRLCY